MSASTTVALRLAWSAAVPAFALAVLENRAESKARSSLMPHPSQEGRGLSLLRYLSFSCLSSRSRGPVGWTELAIFALPPLLRSRREGCGGILSQIQLELPGCASAFTAKSERSRNFCTVSWIALVAAGSVFSAIFATLPAVSVAVLAISSRTTRASACSFQSDDMLWLRLSSSSSVLIRATHETSRINVRATSALRLFSSRKVAL